MLFRSDASKAELQAANRELEAFSYSVSHDLRAPLRRIQGFCEALELSATQSDDARTLDFVGRIRRSVVHMNDLVEAMLGLARVSRKEMHRSSVDLSGIARDVGEELRLGDPHRQGIFLVEDDLLAGGDPALVRIVLENLMGNAWKFTREVNARIEVGRSTDGGSTFFVRDNGAGFDPTYAQGLFAPFQRLHNDSDFPGTGVGLATVQRIVHRHGGKIWAQAAVNEGATFFFSLPAPPR